MSEKASKANVVFGISNLILPPRDIALAGAARYREILHAVNAGENRLGAGYELTPTRALTHSLRGEARNGIFESRVDGAPFLSRGHQSWGGGLRGIIGSALKWDKIGVGGSVCLPESTASLTILPKLFKRLGITATSTVVFAEQTARGGVPRDFKPYELQGTVTTQLGPGMLFAIKQRLEADGKHAPLQNELLTALYDQLDEQGVSRHLVIDTVHTPSHHRKGIEYRVPYGLVLDSMREQGIAPAAVHLSAGRQAELWHITDQERTECDLNALLRGPSDIEKQEELSGMLAGAYLLHRDYNIVAGTPNTLLPVIIETPYSALMHDTSNPLDFTDRVQRLVDHTRAYLDGVEASNPPN